MALLKIFQPLYVRRGEHPIEKLRVHLNRGFCVVRVDKAVQRKLPAADAGAFFRQHSLCNKFGHIAALNHLEGHSAYHLELPPQVGVVHAEIQPRYLTLGIPRDYVQAGVFRKAHQPVAFRRPAYLGQAFVYQRKAAQLAGDELLSLAVPYYVSAYVVAFLLDAEDNICAVLKACSDHAFTSFPMLIALTLPAPHSF